MAGDVATLPFKRRKAAICDANVLIDYVKADTEMLSRLASYWEQVFVPDLVLSEVRQLSAERAKSLGLTIIETPLTPTSGRPIARGSSVPPFRDRARLDLHCE